jgi:hypothetical protein
MASVVSPARPSDRDSVTPSKEGVSRHGFPRGLGYRDRA